MIAGVVHHLKMAILVAGCACSANNDPDAATAVTAQPVAQVQAVAPAETDGNTLTIDKAACRQLIRHQPRADVAYQAGVDISGHAVAPADLSDNVQLQLPENLTIDITPDLTKYLPNANPPYDRLTNSKINIGTVTLSGDTVTMNGQPLSSAAQENLAVLCLQQNK